MKGAITLAVYVAIGITGAAFGQPCCTSTAVKTPFPPIERYNDNGPHPGDRGYTLKPYIPPAPVEISMPGEPKSGALFRGIVTADRVVFIRGHGGRVAYHAALFSKYRSEGTKVEIRGPCYSACTMITGYVEPKNLCIAEGAFFAFHLARGTYDGVPDMQVSGDQYRAQPAKIRAWIDRMGGWEKLPLDGYWTMYDRDLWAAGYPRCAP